MSHTLMSIPFRPLPSRSKTIRALIRCVLVMTAPFVMGCPSADDSASDGNDRPDFSHIELTVAVPRASALAADWRIAAAEWETAHGAVCRVDELDLWRPDAAPMDVPPEMALLVAPLPLIPELVDAAWPASIDSVEDEGAAAAWQDLPAGLRQGVAAPGKHPALVPLDCPVLACYYRTDLLAAAGRKPPTTWREYQQLLDTLSEWAPGLAAVEPWHPDFRATLYFARAVSYALHPDNLSLYIDLETGEPLLAEPPFVRALDASRAALEKLSARSLQLTPTDCYREIATGQAALAIGLPVTDATTLERGAGIRIGVAPLPGTDRVYHRELREWVAPSDSQDVNRVTLVGFDGLSVCVSARVPEETQRAAWNLWTSIDTQEGLAAGAAWPARRLCRASATDDLARSPPSGWPADEWGEQVRTVTGDLQSTRVVFDLPLPHRWEFRDRLTTRLSEALDGTRSAEESLQLAARDWQTLIEQLGARRVRNVCRQCSGLSALPPE